MRNKIVTFSLVTILFVIFIICGIALLQSNSAFSNSTTVWTEKEISDATYHVKGTTKKFDLKETINEADYVFSGTIVDREEYEVEWTDENNEHWGPFPSSIIKVKVNKEYHGKSPVNSDIIKVYYPYSLSMIFEGSFLIKDDCEYVFVTRTLDNEFVKKRDKENPDDKFEQEKYADVYISDSSYNLMAIDDGNVFAHYDYFFWDAVASKKIKNSNTLKTDMISSETLINNNWFVGLERNDFDESFSKLFKNYEKLPNADELMKLHKEIITDEN